MRGVFQDNVKVVNRGLSPLTVTFDGQQTILEPGEGVLPSVTIPYAKNQHPIMGSVDPNNPSLSGGEYLIGVVGKDNCNPLTKEEWNAHCEAISRVDLKVLMEDQLGPGQRVEVRGRGRKTAARNAYEARERGHVNGLGVADRSGD